jgi:hypothetical protein
MVLLSQGCYENVPNKIKDFLSDVLKVGRMELVWQCTEYISFASNLLGEVVTQTFIYVSRHHSRPIAFPNRIMCLGQPSSIRLDASPMRPLSLSTSLLNTCSELSSSGIARTAGSCSDPSSTDRLSKPGSLYHSCRTLRKLSASGAALSGRLSA